MRIYRRATMTPAERKEYEALKAELARQKAVIDEIAGVSDPDAAPQPPLIIQRVAAVETVLDTMLTGGEGR